jgi:hypothetical protein
MNDNQAIVTREEFGATEIATTGETVASVLAARAKAEVEARFIMAMKRPRDMHLVRRKLLDACERPGFAGSATERIDNRSGIAWFFKPINKNDGIEGFTIRFAEEAMRCMGNIDARSSVIWEDENQRMISVEVLDLENNISVPTTIVVKKSIERKYLKKGETAISTRINSYGDPVYLRAATDDEVLVKQNSAISKAMRNGILRLLPGDIQSECKERIMQIRHGAAAEDPAGYSKKVIDSFARIGVKPDELVSYLGHSVESSSPIELTNLQDLFRAIRDGDTTWAEVIGATGKDEPVDDKAPLDKVTEKLKKSRKKKKEPSPSKIDEELKAGRIDYLRSLLTERYQDKAGDVLLNMLEVREKMPVDLETDPDLVEEIISELEGGGE